MLFLSHQRQIIYAVGLFAVWALCYLGYSRDKRKANTYLSHALIWTTWMLMIIH